VSAEAVLRLCLDLNVWVADLLAARKGRSRTVAQSLVDVVRDGRCALGSVQLVISWGMLDRLHLVLTREFAVERGLADTLVNAIATLARRGPSGTSPYVLLGGTGVLPLRDPEDRGVLETALAGQARVLVTHNFSDFLSKDTEILAPGRVAVARHGGREVIVVVPPVMLQWVRQGAIVLPER
jgi:predicted nucleic acid-binding protein